MKSGLATFFTKNDRLPLCGLALLSALSSLLEIAGIGALLPLIATLTLPDFPEKVPFFRDLNAQFDPQKFGIFCAVAALVLYGIRAMVILLTTAAQGAFMRRKESFLARELATNTLNAPYLWHVEHGAPALLSASERVAPLCREVLLPSLLLASDALSVVVLTAVSAYWLPSVTLSGLAFLILCGAVILPLRVVYRCLGESEIRHGDRARKTLTHALIGIKNLKLSGGSDVALEQFNTAVERAATARAWRFICGQVPRVALETAAVFLVLGAFVLMMSLGMPTKEILFLFGAVTAILSRLLPPISRIYYNLALIRQNRALRENLAQFLRPIATEAPQPGSTEKLAFTDKLELRNLTFTYPGATKPVLSHFSATIKKGEITAIRGESGAGKTTLLDVICGLLTCDSGEILVDGVAIGGTDLARRIGVSCVPQQVFLTDGGIAENIALCPADKIDATKLRRALNLAKLSEFTASLPQKEFTEIGENGAKLSGGQRQKIAIARALYRDRAILILDEATAALDTAAETEILQVLTELKGELTIIMVSHSPTAIAVCDREIRL